MKLTSALYFTIFGLASPYVRACTLDGVVITDCTLSGVAAATGCSAQQLADATGTDLGSISVDIESKCARGYENAPSDFLPWKKVTSRGAQFDEEFFDGGSIFNTDDAPTTNHPDLTRIVSIQNELLASHGIGSPDNKNFGYCESQGAMCCWVNNRDTTFTSNTDVCSHNLYDSAKSAHVANGSAIYAGSDAVQCHGFLWEDNETFKGNLLFKVAMVEGLLKGNVRNIPGAPMCGCLEQMPIVEKADCTEITSSSTNLATEYNEDTKELSFVLDSSEINFGSCGSFKDHYMQKVNNPTIGDKFVGACEDDIVEKLEDHAYTKADTSVTWTPVAGRGMYYYKSPSREEFESIWAKSPNQILRRRCLECDLTHKEIYYRRYDTNGLPAELDLMNTVKNRWTEENENEFNVDFKLFTTYEDAKNDQNAWVFCNFDQNVGFPRDCGPFDRVNNMWATFNNGRGKYDVAFYVEN